MLNCHEALDQIVARRLEYVVTEWMCTEPVIVLREPSSVGKSTLLGASHPSASSSGITPTSG
ncbi:MAG: hypothetical protein LC775_10595 [Acidobacteria bacterium]|nr:hypothetical protein [Acidobacteriota bacterium]